MNDDISTRPDAEGPALQKDTVPALSRYCPENSAEAFGELIGRLNALADYIELSMVSQSSADPLISGRIAAAVAGLLSGKTGASSVNYWSSKG